MRIAIDVRHLTHPNPSGVGRYTIHLVEELIAAYPQDTWILFCAGGRKTRDRLPCFDHRRAVIVPVPIMNRILYGVLRSGFNVALEDFLPIQPDAWLFPDLNVVRTRLPYCLTVHDAATSIIPSYFPRKSLAKFRSAGYRDLVCGADKVLAVSESTAVDVGDLFGVERERIVVAPPIVRVGDRRVFDRGNNYILSLGTLEPRKNVDGLIEAYGLWRDRGGDARLVIAGGDGWKMGAIRRALAASVYRDDIELVGFVSEEDKDVLISGARCLVFASFYEGFGMPVLEALMRGVPVITGAHSSLCEQFGDQAVFVDSFTVSDVLMALDITMSTQFTHRQKDVDQKSVHATYLALKSVL